MCSLRKKKRGMTNLSVFVNVFFLTAIYKKTNIYIYFKLMKKVRERKDEGQSKVLLFAFAAKKVSVLFK